MITLVPADLASHLVATCQAVIAAAPLPDAEASGEIPAWFEWLMQWGPLAIFLSLASSGIGIHLSEDFVLIPAGFFAATHPDSLSLRDALIAAYLGLVIGDILWVALCRRYGTRMVHTRWFKRVVHPRRLLEAKHQMERRGALVVVLARFIPGTRTPVLTMAGLLHMPWPKFLMVELPTALVTVPLQFGIGYLAGMGVGSAKSTGELIFWFLALIAATTAIMLGIHWWLQSRRSATKPPRSKAAWLRSFRPKRTALREST